MMPASWVYPTGGSEVRCDPPRHQDRCTWPDVEVRRSLTPRARRYTVVGTRSNMNTTERTLIILPAYDTDVRYGSLHALDTMLSTWTKRGPKVWEHADGARLRAVWDTDGALDIVGHTFDHVALWPLAEPSPRLRQEAVMRTMGGKYPGAPFGAVRMLAVIIAGDPTATLPPEWGGP